MEPEVIVGLGSAGLALLAAIISGLMANRSLRLVHKLGRQQKHEDAAEEAERILHMYRDPLLDAAQTLQSRIYNIVDQSYLERYLTCGEEDEERYARDYTVFAIAEYLCWVEIVRRELRFLDAGEVDRNRQLLSHLTRTQVSFQTDRIDAPFQIFRGRQRAIAELMMVPTNAPEGPRSECLGYATFRRRLDTDAEFASWFGRLRADVDVVAASGPEADVRLARLQHDLIDLIDFLDPKAFRIPPNLRNRLAEPATTVPFQDLREPSPVARSRSAR